MCMMHSHNHNDSGNEPSGKHESWLYSRTGIATLVAVSVLGFLIYEGHGAHLLGFVPYLLILACPLMHIFMHGGHHHHQSDEAKEKPVDKKDQHKGGCH